MNFTVPPLMVTGIPGGSCCRFWYWAASGTDDRLYSNNLKLSPLMAMFAPGDDWLQVNRDPTDHSLHPWWRQPAWCLRQTICQDSFLCSMKLFAVWMCIDAWMKISWVSSHNRMKRELHSFGCNVCIATTIRDSHIDVDQSVIQFSGI